MRGWLDELPYYLVTGVYWVTLGLLPIAVGYALWASWMRWR